MFVLLRPVTTLKLLLLKLLNRFARVDISDVFLGHAGETGGCNGHVDEAIETDYWLS